MTPAQLDRLRTKHIATQSRQPFVDYICEEPARELDPGRLETARLATEAVYGVPEDRRTRQSVLRRYGRSREIAKRFRAPLETHGAHGAAPEEVRGTAFSLDVACPDSETGKHCGDLAEHEHCRECCFCGEKPTVFSTAPTRATPHRTDQRAEGFVNWVSAEGATPAGQAAGAGLLPGARREGEEC